MDITEKDEKLIGFFANMYSSRTTSFEDLVQEGRLAVLSCQNEKHKYLKVRKAIQEVARRDHLYTNRCKGRPSAYDASKEEFVPVFEPLDKVDLEDLIIYLFQTTDLTQQERNTIQLLFLEDKTPEEAALILETTLSSVSKWKHIALEKLRKCYVKLDLDK